jgi:WXG100 family type VII secretion target
MSDIIKVDSRQIRDVSSTLQTEANSLFNHFETMLNEVRSFTSTMSGTTIEAIYRQFNNMTPTFERVRTDMLAYSTWLSQAAEDYERLEREKTNIAQTQGIF